MATNLGCMVLLSQGLEKPFGLAVVLQEIKPVAVGGGVTYIYDVRNLDAKPTY
jgi:hypothetical protein